MPAVEDKVSITLDLPKSVVDGVRRYADRARHSVEAEAEQMLRHAITVRDELPDLMEQAQREYDEYRSRTGKSRPTGDELIEQLRRVREQVADELYPD